MSDEPQVLTQTSLWLQQANAKPTAGAEANIMAVAAPAARFPYLPISMPLAAGAGGPGCRAPNADAKSALGTGGSRPQRKSEDLLVGSHNNGRPEDTAVAWASHVPPPNPTRFKQTSKLCSWLVTRGSPQLQVKPCSSCLGFPPWIISPGSVALNWLHACSRGPHGQLLLCKHRRGAGRASRGARRGRQHLLYL